MSRDDKPTVLPRRKRPEIFHPPEREISIAEPVGRKVTRNIPRKGLIEDSLYWRIRGYSYPEVTHEWREVKGIDPETGAEVLRGEFVPVKVVYKTVAPDVQAIMFGATNIIPERYQNKQTINQTVELKTLSDEQLDTKIAELAAKTGIAQVVRGKIEAPKDPKD